MLWVGVAIFQVLAVFFRHRASGEMHTRARRKSLNFASGIYLS